MLRFELMERQQCVRVSYLSRNLTMTKSELIETIAQKQSQLAHKDIDLAVKAILEQMAQSLSEGERIEIRGFGSFSLHYRPPRHGRNPKTGEAVSLPAKQVPHFKPGKELRDRANSSIPQLNLINTANSLPLTPPPPPIPVIVETIETIERVAE